MTLNQFDNGYWYTIELKKFCGDTRDPSREQAAQRRAREGRQLFLQTGKIKSPTKRSLSRSGTRDVERGLSLDLPVVVYTNDKETKRFLEREAQKLAPGLKRRSGVRYRLNRWREEQLAKGVHLTYRELVEEYVRLNQTNERFARIPHGRYINFVSDFLAAEKGAKREQAIRAWEKLKMLDVPKNYRSWVRFRSSKPR